MTMVRVTTVGVDLTTDQKASIADGVTGAFAAVEVGNDSDLIRKGFTVLFESLASDDMWLGANAAATLSPANRAALITVRVMAGPWTDPMKTELFERVERIVREVGEIPRGDDGSGIWMTLIEVPDGGWGVAGSPVSIRDFAPLFAEDRQARIHAYLDRLDSG